MQYLCNRLFSSEKKINDDAVRKMLLRIIIENEAVYASYINLFTPLQFKILRAVAMNDGVQNPTSSEFLSAYDLGAASSVSLAVKSLSDKGFLDRVEGRYMLNDLFFNSWLKYRSGVLWNEPHIFPPGETSRPARRARPARPARPDRPARLARPARPARPARLFSYLCI